ncbi:exodeoxyribonuclease VII small subunit [Azospirillum endophyticum]
MVLSDMPPSASAIPNPGPNPGTAIPPDIAALSFEDALAELERIVRQLEEGRGKLDDAISSYERGTALKRHCEMKLREAQAKIDRITVTADGSLGTEPARID